LLGVWQVVLPFAALLFAVWELMADRDFITCWYDRRHHPVA
jgi:hypothetical protein